MKRVGRWSLGLLAVGVAGALVLAVNAWWRGRAAGAVLVAQVRELDRTLHSAALQPDSFAAKIAPQLDRLEQLRRDRPLDAKEGEACKQLSADRPVPPEVAARCKEFLDARREALGAVLTVASLARPGLPEGMAPYGDPHAPLARDGFLRFEDLLRADALLVHEEVAAGAGHNAVRHCLDGLHLARLMAPGGGLLGAMIAYSGYHLLYPPCAKAIGSADPRDALAASDELKDARAEIPPLSEAVAFEQRVGALEAFGRFLPPAQWQALPRAAQAQALANDPGPAPIFGKLFVFDALDRLNTLMNETVSAVDLPRTERQAALDALRAEAQRSWNPIVKIGYTDYGKFADRFEQELVLHDVLLAIADLRTNVFEDGRWPDQLPELYPQRPHLPSDIRWTARGESGHALVAMGPIEPVIVPIEGAR